MSIDSMIPSVEIEPQERGEWTVERFIVDADAARLSLLQGVKTGRGVVAPGTYTALRHRGRLVMSDTPDEKRDHWAAVMEAKGICLVIGLGLGMVANAMARRDGVTGVIVVEKDIDVIQMVLPHLDDKVIVLHADVFDWKMPTRGSAVWSHRRKVAQYTRRGRVIAQRRVWDGQVWPVKFGVVWVDIWNNICLDSVEERKRLRRKFGRRAEWVGCWADPEIKRLEAEQRRKKNRWALVNDLRRILR